MMRLPIWLYDRLSPHRLTTDVEAVKSKRHCRTGWLPLLIHAPLWIGCASGGPATPQLIIEFYGCAGSTSVATPPTLPPAFEVDVESTRETGTDLGVLTMQADGGRWQRFLPDSSDCTTSSWIHYAPLAVLHPEWSADLAGVLHYRELTAGPFLVQGSRGPVDGLPETTTLGFDLVPGVPEDSPYLLLHLGTEEPVSSGTLSIVGVSGPS